jgi:hypothetical protein
MSWIGRVLAPAAALLASAGAGFAAPATTPPADDVPPFVGARGDIPLAFAVTGLAAGFAEIGPGVRPFAVCWQGGDGPFTVTLRGAAGHTLVAESGLQGAELILASKPVSFAPGAYQVDVADAQGTHVDGQFTVVDAAQLPPGAATPVAAAQAANQAGPAYRYEAYLRVIPAAIGAPGSPADQLARTLCHRQ